LASGGVAAKHDLVHAGLRNGSERLATPRGVHLADTLHVVVETGGGDAQDRAGVEEDEPRLPMIVDLHAHCLALERPGHARHGRE
jgi:hypothetical protein